MSAGREVADIFRRHGDAYRQAQAGHLGRVERRVMSAIELIHVMSRCNTAAMTARLAEISEVSITTAVAWVLVANIRLLTRRLSRS
jgi:hypothetical protein